MSDDDTVVPFPGAKSKAPERTAGEIESTVGEFARTVETLIKEAEAQIEFEGKFMQFVRGFRETGDLPWLTLNIEFDKYDASVAKAMERDGWTSYKFGWPVYDTDDSSGWSNDGFFVGKRPTNCWPTLQVSKEIGRDEAVKIFAAREFAGILGEYGRFNPMTSGTAVGWDTMKYSKESVRKTRGVWDIRTHPRHSELFHEGKRFYIAMRDAESIQVPRNEAEFKDMIRALDMMSMKISLKGADTSNVDDISGRFRR